MNNNLFKKFLSFSYGSWIGLIIGFLGTIITTRIIVPEDFGKASMFTLTLNISMLFIMFGTDQAFVRFFYEETEEQRGGLLYNCMSIPLILSVVVSTIIFVFRSQISVFLFDEENKVAILMLIVGVFAQIIYQYALSVIRMKQRGNLYSILEIVYRTLTIVTVLVFYLFLGSSYKIIIYSTVINFILLSIVAIVSERNFWSTNNIKLKNLKHSKRDIFDFGSPLVLTMLISWLFQSFDKIAIKQWSSLNELGLYAAAFKIIAMVSVLQGAFSAFWTPVAYEKFENEPENKKFYEKICKIVTISMLCVAVGSIMGKDIIVFLLGERYRAAADIMPFLVFMPIMYTISETTVIGINFYKKPRWHILIALTSCGFNIIGNWILVPKYGAIGASIATAFSYVIFFSLRTKISLKYFKINYDLKKLYLMLSIIVVYSLYSIYTKSFFMNIIIGMLVLLFILIVYNKDFKEGYKIVKQKYLSSKTN